MINWEAAGAIGEIIGALGVIITLVFLVFQIRQNSRLLQNNTNQLQQNHKLAIAQALGQSPQQQAAMVAISQDADLADIMFRGFRDYEGLEPLERLRFGMALGPMMAGAAARVEQHLELDIKLEDNVDETIAFAFEFLRWPGGREWWRRNREKYSPRFRALIDEALARSSTHE